MSSEPILLDCADAIATVTLNRPDAGNAIDLGLARALLAAAIRCDSDPAIRCVVLTGTGKLFCGGGDIGIFAAGDAGPVAVLGELAGTLHMALIRLMRMAKPLVVLVNGPAAGAGMSLAIAGDVVLAVASAHFTPAYGAVGLTPDGGMSWLLPRLIGLRRAQQMMLTNRRVSAEEAVGMGLVTASVADAALASEGADIARQLARSATGAIGVARGLLLDGASTALEAQLDREMRQIAAAGGTAEGREGVAAYLAGRQADFAGVS